MGASQFDEAAFFAAIRDSGARALVIGRRALVFLGLPVMTADYDFWLHIDDMELFNGAVVPFDLHPSRTPEEARRKGRYVLSIDVAIPSIDDLMATKRFAARPKDLEDIRLLEFLRENPS